ncbi:MAG TPA: RNA polymerase sigma factor, partial [Puia sp.]|nr:RNA polymerase sigma factor [Puia sp.]
GARASARARTESEVWNFPEFALRTRSPPSLYSALIFLSSDATWLKSPCIYYRNFQNSGLELTATILHDELIERCKQGDARSYAEIYQKYSKAMYNTSLRIVNNTGDAEDVLQESFTDAFGSIQSFQYKSTFGAWLKKIVVNKSINCLRKRKMDLVDMEKTNLGHVPEEESLDENEIQLKVEEIKKCVRLLPNGYRTVLSLYLFEGYDHEEIAEILRVSHATVRTQYMRAKQKLISLIKQGGVS